MKQTGSHYGMPNTFISSKQIKVVSPFKSIDAWLQTSILYEILPLNRVTELYILYTHKIHRYETFVNMFVFSLNRLTPSRGEGI